MRHKEQVPGSLDDATFSQLMVDVGSSTPLKVKRSDFDKMSHPQRGKFMKLLSKNRGGLYDDPDSREEF